MRYGYILLSLMLAAGCTQAERREVKRDVGAYVGVPAVDLDPSVDSDGDGDPANDVDNGPGIAEGLIQRFLRNPTATGAGATGAGLGIFLLYRFLQRKLKKNP